MFLPRKANAEVGDERPGARNIERLGDRARIEDRDPADAEAAGARGEPECVQRADRRIAARFRHGASAEAMALFGRLVTKDGKLYRRIVEASKLEPGVKRRPLTSVGAERLTVGRLEIRPDGRAAPLVVNAHEAGRLTIANRRRERREVEELGQRRLVRRFRAKMADVAPPRQKLGKVRLERGVELGRFAEGMGQFRFSPPYPQTLAPGSSGITREAQSAKKISRPFRFDRSVMRRRAGARQGHRVGSFADCAIRSRLERSIRPGRQAVRPAASRGRRTRDELACAAYSPSRARFLAM